jgi:leader peptidase (prepilin peptidase) / N-methyltransferase
MGLFVFGAIWGSFASALCGRWAQGESIVMGRSRCDHCRQALRAFELVPILSFAFQGGVCRRCAQPIGRDSLYVELFCATFGAGCALLFAPLNAVAAAAMGWLLVPLILLDWRHFWLPDPLIIVLAGCGVFAGGLLMNAPSLTEQLIGGAAGYAALQLIRLGYSRLRGVEAMGAGDPKLLGAIGLWVGWPALPFILLLSSLIGLIHMVLQWRTVKLSTTQLPLGSYMGCATIIWAVGRNALALVLP